MNLNEIEDYLSNKGIEYSKGPSSFNVFVDGQDDSICMLFIEAGRLAIKRGQFLEGNRHLMTKVEDQSVLGLLNQKFKVINQASTDRESLLRLGKYIQFYSDNCKEIQSLINGKSIKTTIELNKVVKIHDDLYDKIKRKLYISGIRIKGKEIKKSDADKAKEIINKYLSKLKKHL